MDKPRITEFAKNENIGEYVTWPMVRKVHGDEDYKSFLKFMDRQTVALLPEGDAIYRVDYERWLHQNTTDFD